MAINCAGIGIAKKTLSVSREEATLGQCVPHSLQDFTKVLTINTVGSFNVARLAAQRMSSRDADHNGLRGCIINTASIAAMDGQRGQVAYATSKAALVGMTLPMARDLASFGIRVMTIVRLFGSLAYQHPPRLFAFRRSKCWFLPSNSFPFPFPILRRQDCLTLHC